MQDRLDHVTCHVVADGPPQPIDMERIRTSIQRVMGADCTVDFTFPDAIPPSPSGKHMYTISRINADEAS